MRIRITASGERKNPPGSFELGGFFAEVEKTVFIHIMCSKKVVHAAERCIIMARAILLLDLVRVPTLDSYLSAMQIAYYFRFSAQNSCRYHF